jgi:hypothetical protein
MLIDPAAFEACFPAWAASLAGGFEREVVAIDGKTLPRSFDRKHERAPLHLVSAWASTQGLVLGQRCVGDKSNEITAILSLLDQLILQGSIVILDDLGRHRSYPGRLPRSMQQILLVSCRRGTCRSKCRPAIHLQSVTQSAYDVL